MSLYKQALQLAIFQYESELKQGKEYAKIMVEGLTMAKERIEKYEEILSKNKV